MNGKELIRLLEENGWRLKSIKGSHYKMEKDGRCIPVPVHGNKDVPKGTLNDILRQAGLK
jgi:predicted RNA binding protein YcfA (HicA-like mRNA interferase family)